MGFFSNLFKSKEQREREEREKIVQKAADKVVQLLNDDAVQMERIPSMFQNMYDNKSIDRLPGAQGEFGRCASNPIPVNGPFGEVTYLSRLRLAATGEKVFFHRCGTSGSNVDVFELLTQSGNFYDVLYLDMYHTHKSHEHPSGYEFQQEPLCLIRGVHSKCEGFPENLLDKMVNFTLKNIGLPCCDAEAGEINVANASRAKRKYAKCQELLTQYSMILKLGPDDVKAHFLRGELYRLVYRYTEAIEDFSRVLEINPNSVEAYFQRARSYSASQRYQEAIADYSKIIELQPELVMAYNNRADICLRLGKYVEALADCDRALAIDPKFAMAHTTRSEVYYSRHNYRLALEEVEKALALTPGDAYAQRHKQKVLSAIAG